MKLKTSFQGLLLSFWKRLKMKIILANISKDPELFFAVGLVLLWLLIFLLSNLKHKI